MSAAPGWGFICERNTRELFLEVCRLTLNSTIYFMGAFLGPIAYGNIAAL